MVVFNWCNYHGSVDECIPTSPRGVHGAMPPRRHIIRPVEIADAPGVALPGDVAAAPGPLTLQRIKRLRRGRRDHIAGQRGLVSTAATSPQARAAQRRECRRTPVQAGGGVGATPLG